MADGSLLTEVYPARAYEHAISIDSPLPESKINRFSSIFRSLKKQQQHQQQESILAPKFKHRNNFSPEDIEEIRRLLTAERVNQNGVDFAFWTPDYERMMKDDWLVSRFLLRGLKLSENSVPPEAITTSSGHEADDGESLKHKKLALHLHTLDLIKNCAKFRLEHLINGQTEESEFPVEWLKTNGLFSFKRDLAGNAVIYMRIRLHKPKVIESDELRHQFKRYLLFTLEQGDRALFNAPGKGICCFFDMSKATMENIDLELMSWMMKSFKNCSPKLLCYVIVYNLPRLFSATFRWITNNLMPQSNKLNLRFVYGNEVFSYIAKNDLPSYMLDELGTTL